MEKINFCSAMQPKSLKEFQDERCEFCADYYRAADVDVLLADVRRLVEAAEMLIAPVPLEYISFNNRISDIELTRKRVEALQRAIAAVERHFSSKTSQP